MFFRRRMISALDKARLLESIDRERDSWTSYAPYLDFFRAEIRRTPAVEPAEVPGDAITMNSRFALLDPRTEERVSYTLTYPEEEERRAGRISVASQMGTALLGARVGDEVFWLTSDGLVSARVTKIHHQPEAAARRRSPADGRAASARQGGQMARTRTRRTEATEVEDADAPRDPRGLAADRATLDRRCVAGVH